MKKKEYNSPQIIAVALHDQLLYRVSGENQEGDDWDANAKDIYFGFEDDEEDEDL